MPPNISVTAAPLGSLSHAHHSYCPQEVPVTEDCSLPPHHPYDPQEVPVTEDCSLLPSLKCLHSSFMYSSSHPLGLASKIHDVLYTRNLFSASWRHPSATAMDCIFWQSPDLNDNSKESLFCLLFIYLVMRYGYRVLGGGGTCLP